MRSTTTHRRRARRCDFEAPAPGARVWRAFEKAEPQDETFSKARECPILSIFRLDVAARIPQSLEAEVGEQIAPRGKAENLRPRCEAPGRRADEADDGGGRIGRPGRNRQAG